MYVFQNDVDWFRSLTDDQKAGVVWELCISLRNERAAALRHRSMEHIEAVRRATLFVADRMRQAAQFPPGQR